MNTHRVPTNKNTPFTVWKDLVLLEFSKRSMLPYQIQDIRHKHAWENGDTPYSWVDTLIRQNEQKKRREIMELARKNLVDTR